MTGTASDLALAHQGGTSAHDDAASAVDATGKDNVGAKANGNVVATTHPLSQGAADDATKAVSAEVKDQSDANEKTKVVATTPRKAAADAAAKTEAMAAEKETKRCDGSSSLALVSASTHHAEYMRLKRAVENDRVPSVIITEWQKGTQAKNGLLRSFVKHGGDLSRLSLEVSLKKVKELKMMDKYGYVTRAEMIRDRGFTEAEADAVMASCVSKGGRFVRANPNAPTVLSLRQYWIVLESTGTATEIMEEHVRFFGDIGAVSEDQIEGLLTSIESSEIQNCLHINTLIVDSPRRHVLPSRKHK
jgi:hypothetical protein